MKRTASSVYAAASSYAAMPSVCAQAVSCAAKNIVIILAGAIVASVFLYALLGGVAALVSVLLSIIIVYIIRMCGHNLIRFPGGT